MYQIYANGQLIHDMNLEDERFRISAADLELELGKTGSLRFTVYPSHPAYDSIQRMKTLVSVSRNYQEIYSGRVFNVRRGLYNEKQVDCEGALAFLLDTVIDPHTYDGDFSGYMAFVLGMHNSRVEPEKQILPGRMTVGDFTPFAVSERREYRPVYNVLVERMANPSGGYLQIRHEGGYKYLDLLAYGGDVSDLSGQPIELGKNLLDIKQETNSEAMFSVIVPRGAKIEGTDIRLDIRDVNSGQPHIVNAAAVELCGGKVYREVIFDNITNAQTLKTEGERYLAENYAGESSVEITAVDLTADSYELGKWVTVSSPYHFPEGPQLFQIRKMSINLLDPAKNKITIGAVRRGLSETVAKMSSSGNQEEAEPVQPYVMDSGVTGIWTWKIFSDNSCEFFGKIPVASYAVSTALGGLFRGESLYGANDYEYPIQMAEAPAVSATFQTRNGMGAWAWIFSESAETAQRYLPQCYLVRPTTATGIMGNINIIAKGKVST